MMKTALLADHADLMPTLAQWFQAQWPDNYRDRDLADIECHFHAELHRDRIPLRLVALEGAEPLGTIVIREHALASSPEYGPGIGGLWTYRREAVPGQG